MHKLKARLVKRPPPSARDTHLVASPTTPGAQELLLRAKRAPGGGVTVGVAARGWFAICVVGVVALLLCLGRCEAPRGSQSKERGPLRGIAAGGEARGPLACPISRSR